MEEHWKQGGEAVDMSIKKGQLLAQNILEGRVAAFDLAPLPKPHP
jgi:NTE family protein